MKWLGCVGVLLVGLFIIGGLAVPAVRMVHELGRRDECCGHLHLLDLAINQYRSSHSNFPTRLSQLTECTAVTGRGLTPTEFICPGSDTKPGSLTKVDLWTDYILIIDLNGSHSNDTPLILCTSENHFGRGICALERNGSPLWLDESNLFDRLYSDTNLEIVVSEALTKRSKGRYRSRP